MNRTALLIGMSVATSLLVGCASYRLAKRIEEDHCAPLDDDMGNVIHERRLADLKEQGKSARKALLRLAESNRPAKACAIAWLGELGDRRVVPVLYEVLSAGPGGTNPIITSAQPYALNYIGVLEGATAMLSVLPFVRDQNWAIQGIAALGTIDDAESRRVLGEIIEHSPDENVRRAAVQSIARLGDRDALPLLIRVSKEEHLNFWTRRALVEAFIAIDALETLDDELRLIETIASDQRGENSASYLRGAVFQRLKPELDAFDGSDESPMRRRLLNAVFQISGWTSLMQSAQHGQLEAARELIGSGTHVNAKNIFGGTALTLAAEAGAHEIVEMLLQNGARFIWEGTTALMEASRNGHLKIVKTLLQYGSPVSTKSTGIGWTALMYAAQGHADIVRLLLTNGAEVNVASANGGLTPLMLASWQGDQEATELLLKAGARVSDKADGYWQHDALLFASWGGSAGVVELLLKAGAEMDVTSRDGRTLLMLAAESGQTEIVRLLIEHGADVSIRDRNYQTALSFALTNKHFAIATLLRQAGAE